MLMGVTPILQQRNGEAYSVAYADSTIAHELCHGIGIYHHGDKDRGARPWKYEVIKGAAIDLVSGETIDGFQMWVDGAKVFVRNEAGAIFLPQDMFAYLPPGEETPVWIGERNGQHSGDEACLMRYDLAHAYRSLSDASTIYYVPESEIWGTRLCTSPAGTGVNMPTHEPQSRYGGCDTGRGDCAHKFVVSDHWEKKNK